MSASTLSDEQRTALQVAKRRRKDRDRHSVGIRVVLGDRASRPELLVDGSVGKTGTGPGLAICAAVAAPEAPPGTSVRCDLTLPPPPQPTAAGLETQT